MGTDTDDELSEEKVDVELLGLDESEVLVVFVAEDVGDAVELADDVVSELAETEELELNALVAP
jgi:hypothetical protein